MKKNFGYYFSPTCGSSFENAAAEALTLYKKDPYNMEGFIFNKVIIYVSREDDARYIE